MAKGGATSRHQLRVAGLDEVAGFGDDFLDKVYQFAQAGFPINKLGR